MDSWLGKKGSKTIISLVSFFILYSVILVPQSHALIDLPLDKPELSDEELAGVTAQAGITIAMDITMNQSFETMAWGDRDGYSGVSGAGWIGYSSLEINTLHIWPRTDYSMDPTKWNLLEFLTFDVVTLDDPETDTDHGELYGLDHITKLRFGIPTLSVTMSSMRGELMLGPSDSDYTIGGQVNGAYMYATDIHPANLNQSLGRFELRNMNLSTSGGQILIGPHGWDTTSVDGKTGSGITVAVNGTGARLEFGYLGFSDTDNGNWIGLENLTVDDGMGGYFSYDTPLNTPIQFDVGSDETGRSAVWFVLSDHVLPRSYSAEHLVFCGQDIGSLSFGGVTQGPSQFLIAAHNDGTRGIDYEFFTKLGIDSVGYAYNNAPSSFAMSGIHAVGTAAGAPEDPSSWSFSGEFMIGDLDGEEIDVDNDPGNAAAPNPATIDVGTDTTTGNTSMVLGAPMKGTIRIEDVSFGGASFGPCAIDGITVHHLNLTFSPN